MISATELMAHDKARRTRSETRSLARIPSVWVARGNGGSPIVGEPGSPGPRHAQVLGCPHELDDSTEGDPRCRTG